jgi:hypothetical protein
VLISCIYEFACWARKIAGKTLSEVEGLSMYARPSLRARPFEAQIGVEWPSRGRFVTLVIA